MSNPDATCYACETAHAPPQLLACYDQARSMGQPHEMHGFDSLGVMASAEFAELPDLLACGATRSSLWHTTGKAGLSPRLQS